MANNLPFKVQITWRLNRALLCLHENSVRSCEAEFHTGINVPSTTGDPGKFLIGSSSCTFNSVSFNKAL